MSPRRSSRARSSANPPPTSQTASSTSSTTLKNTRTLQRSVSVEDPAEPDNDNTNEPIMPRRSRRNGVEESRDAPNSTKPIDGFEDGQEPGDDDAEEVTRCICNKPEYPGPTYNLMYGRGETAVVEPMTKDTGDFFVQCDKCLVWQHGGCVGFQDEAELPDEYFCELCRPKLHKIYKEQNGRRSHYFTSRQLGAVTKEQPAENKPTTKKEGDASRSSSISSGEPRKKDGKKAMSESTKRRATMNSRGAYDEDEMLRRAIEESNRETGTLGKRTRDAGDDSKQALKRQRTGSMSSDSKRSTSPTATDDGPGRKSKQSLRGAAARNNKEREAREKVKEQQLAARAEAASKRHARSERRRGDDSPPPSPSVSPSKALSKDKTDATSTTRTTSGKTKSSRNARGGVGSGGRRLGRNQYTRDRDLATNGGALDSDTPMRDLHHNDSHTNGNSPSHHNGINGESGRSSKAKTHPARTSLNEMKRRVAAILEFVGQMQTQSSRQQVKEQQRTGQQHQQNGLSKLSTTENGNANGSGSGSGSSEKGGGSTPTATGAAVAAALSNATGIAGLVKAVQDATDDVVITPPDGEGGNNGTSSAGGERERPKFRDDSEFKDMGSTQMMEALTRELIAWQRVYGVYSR